MKAVGLDELAQGACGGLHSVARLAPLLRADYQPLRTIAYDSEDLDPSSPHVNTPTTTVAHLGSCSCMSGDGRAAPADADKVSDRFGGFVACSRLVSASLVQRRLGLFSALTSFQR